MDHDAPYETMYNSKTKEIQTLYGSKDLVSSAIKEYNTCEEKGDTCMKGSYGSVHKVSVGTKEYYVKYLYFSENLVKKKLNIYNEISTAIHLTKRIPTYVSNLMASIIFEKESSVSAYLIFEAPPGITLLEYLKYNNPSEKKNIQKYKSIYCSLKAAQEAIHRAGFVHRDIKPANIFVVHERSGIYKCKLIDFGFTVPIGTEGATAGTLNYMPKSLHTSRTTRAKKSHNDYSVKTIWNENFLFKESPPDCSAASGPPLPPVNNSNSNSNTNSARSTNKNSKSKTRRSSRSSRSSNRE